MIKWAMIAATVLLAGCEQQSAAELEKYNRLEERLSQLEGQVARMATRETQKAALLPPEAPKPVEVKPRYTHQLIGTSFKDDGDHKYMSEAKCEAARQALLDSWAYQDANEQYVVIRNRPAPTCLPIG